MDLGLGGLMAARVGAVGGGWRGLVRFFGAAGAGVVGAASAGAAEAGEICVAPWSAWWQQEVGGRGGGGRSCSSGEVRHSGMLLMVGRQ